MQNCDVFVLSSIVETFGVVLIEVLAVGKPVVATKCGGPEDIVNQDNGILVPTKDVHALAEAMYNIYLNINKYDASLIRNDCISRFGKDSFVEKLRHIYKSCNL
jgi:glycosyltransferase involved in cell wall biosynthesis